MITCTNCGFSVNDTMKFAMMKNHCPACGNQLFSDEDSDLIAELQSRISYERFSSGLNKELIYDVAIFIFNEIKTRVPVETVFVEEEELDERELMKKEIEEELADELVSVLNDSPEAETKAEKLKRMHEQRVRQNPNLGKEVPMTHFRGASKSGQRVSRSE